jgi:hypothetical protein
VVLHRTGQGTEQPKLDSGLQLTAPQRINYLRNSAPVAEKDACSRPLQAPATAMATNRPGLGSRAAGSEACEIAGWTVLDGQRAISRAGRGSSSLQRKTGLCGH